MERTSSQMQIGPLMRREREARGMTLQDMATQTGYTKGHLSQVETGKELSGPKLVSAYERILGLPEGTLTAEADDAAKSLADTSESVALWHRDMAEGLGGGEIEAEAETKSGRLVESIAGDHKGGSEILDPSLKMGTKGDNGSSGRVLSNKSGTEGLWQTLTAACELLAQAADTPPPANGQPILISLRSENEAFARQKELGQRWRALLIQVLNKGWNVMHVRHIPSDSRQVVEQIRYIVRNLLGKEGHYEPYYILSPEERRRSNTVIPDMLMVPGHEAMLFLASYQSDYVDSALVLRDAQQQELLRQAFVTDSTHVRKLLQVFPRGSLAFEAALSRKEASVPGDLLIKKDGFSTTLVPLSVLRTAIDRWIEKAEFKSQAEKERNRADLEFLYLEREERRKGFFARLSRDRILHIVHKQKLEALLYKGQISRDDWFLNRLPAPANETSRLFSEVEIVTCLRRVVELIEHNPNYELRLIEDDVAPESVELFMEIIGSETALFEALHTKGNSNTEPKQVDLAILEPTAIQALHNDFFKIWDRLHSDKRAIIEWLEAQIRKIERQ